MVYKILIILSLLFFSFTQPQPTISTKKSDFPTFNPDIMESYQGTILNVQKLRLINRPAAVVQILLKTDQGTLTVEMGPEWFLDSQGITLSNRQHIMVKGSLAQAKNTKFLIASSFQTEKQEIQLRDEKTGKPLWK